MINQKEMLFMRGKAMSGAPIIKGTNQLPNPPIKAGMTTKKTMIRPCAVITTFHICPSGAPSAMNKPSCTPGLCNSIRISSEKRPPITPPTTAKSR